MFGVRAISSGDSSLTQAQALEYLQATNPKQVKQFVGRQNRGHPVILGAVYPIRTYTCTCGAVKESSAAGKRVQIRCACKGNDTKGRPLRHDGWTLNNFAWFMRDWAFLFERIKLSLITSNWAISSDLSILYHRMPSVLLHVIRMERKVCGCSSATNLQRTPMT